MTLPSQKVVGFLGSLCFEWFLLLSRKQCKHYVFDPQGHDLFEITDQRGERFLATMMVSHGLIMFAVR